MSYWNKLEGNENRVFFTRMYLQLVTLALFTDDTVEVEVQEHEKFPIKLWLEHLQNLFLEFNFSSLR